MDDKRPPIYHDFSREQLVDAELFVGLASNHLQAAVVAAVLVRQPLLDRISSVMVL